MEIDAMERVLTAYENNMRPSAFQCCTDANYVTGFRMQLAEFTTNYGDSENIQIENTLKASTGCIGACSGQCHDEVPFNYESLDDLQFEFATSTNGGIERIV